MYGHFTHSTDVKQTIVFYLFEDVPLILDATIVIGSPDEMYKTLKKLASKGDKCFLVTLHLPIGTNISDQDATNLMRQVLADRGVDADTVPYILGRHETTNGAHFHLVFLNRTFAGRPVDVDTSIRSTQASHRRLSLSHGLEEPIYFDPDALPTFQPPIILRRTKHIPTKKKKALCPVATEATSLAKDRLYSLNIDLNRVFLEHQPTSLSSLNKALSEIGADYRIALVPGQKAKFTYATTGADPIFLNKLGPAWYSDAIRARMVFADLLARIRPILALRALVRPHLFKTMEHPHDDRNEDRCIAASYVSRTRPKATGSDGASHQQPSTAPELVGEADHRGGNGPHFGLIPTLGPADRRAKQVARTSGGTRSDVSRRDGRRRLKRPNGWIAKLCRAAKSFGGRLTKIYRVEDQTRVATIQFRDGGVSSHTKSTRKVDKLTADSVAFVSTWPERAAPERQVEPYVEQMQQAEAIVEVEPAESISALGSEENEPSF